jgi:hypothetical protein
VTAFEMSDFTLACPRCGKAFAIRNRQAGQRYLCPHCRQPFSLQPAAERSTPPPQALAPTASSSELLPEDLPTRLTAISTRRSRKNALRLIGPAGIVLAVVCVVVLFLWDRHERGVDKRVASDSVNAANRLHGSGAGAPASQLASSRQPIDLLYAPAGARIVIHLRPARLWATNAGRNNARSDESRAEELLECIGPLADWARQQTDDWCLYPPNQIDETVFSFALRSPGEPPEVAVLVRLARPAPLAEIDHRFGGTRSGQSPLPVFIKSDRVLVVGDPQTFAVGPAESSHEMVDARDHANPTDASIEELLKETDRSRDFTIVFRPDDLDRFRETLAPAPWANALHQLAAWLDPDAVEGAIVSVRLDDPLRVRLVARARPVMFPPRLATTLKERLDHLPTDLLKYVGRLQPETPGSRKLVGRLPAMCKALALGAAVTSHDRVVTLESVLPERAAPNLSLATWLLLTEGPALLRNAPTAPVTAGRDGPKSLAARLKTVVDVDFRRTPLSEAFESIGGDIGVNFELDGGALKLAGYTKNMPQTFQIKGAPAIQSLQKILKAYPKLALVADEARRTIVITTSEAAAAQHKSPMALGN